MNNSMAGFYRSKYKPAVEPSKSVPTEDDNHLMFSTHFESCHARRAFPCFDEPNLKATFDFGIEIPEDLVALSNMPEKGVREGKEGFKVVSFERSPVMSTYVSQSGRPLRGPFPCYTSPWADVCLSFWLGPSEIWSMLKTLPSENIRASLCLCESTRQKA